MFLVWSDRVAECHGRWTTSSRTTSSILPGLDRLRRILDDCGVPAGGDGNSGRCISAVARSLRRRMLAYGYVLRARGDAACRSGVTSPGVWRIASAAPRVSASAVRASATDHRASPRRMYIEATTWSPASRGWRSAGRRAEAERDISPRRAWTARGASARPCSSSARAGSAPPCPRSCPDSRCRRTCRRSTSAVLLRPYSTSAATYASSVARTRCCLALGWCRGSLWS